MIGFELSPGAGQGPRGPVQPLSAFFRAGGGSKVALAPAPGNGLSIWSEIGPSHAAWMRLDSNDASTRYSWRETLLMELRNVYTVADITTTGSWSQLQSSGSGLAGSYTGNRAISTSSATAIASVTVDRVEPYDVWIHFTGRTGGGFCRVEIDGAQDLVTEISDPAGLGYKAFSTYAATDLQRRQSVKVASGLTGAHEVSLRPGGAATPGGNNILIEAVAITGGLSDPRILPPVWQPETTYQTGDEVQFGGLYYAARANGVSGLTGPQHSNGIASDGALDWRVDNRCTYPKFICIDYPSEREYATRFETGGVTTELGGQTHGHEALTAQTIALDGAVWVPASTGTGLSIGAEVLISETLDWQSSGGTNVGECILTRRIIPGAIHHAVEVVGTGPEINFEWLYTGMLPMVHWDGESRSLVTDTVSVPASTPIALSEFAGTNPDNLNFAGVRRMGLTGDIAGGTFLYGIEAGALPDLGNIVNQFDTFLRPNLDASSASGSLDWKAKAYVTASTDGDLTLGTGDVLSFYNRHVLRLEVP